MSQVQPKGDDASYRADFNADYEVYIKHDGAFPRLKASYSHHAVGVDKVVNSVLFSGDPDLLRLWLLLLRNAHRGERPFKAPQGDLVQRGQCVASLRKLARVLERSDRSFGHSTVDRMLDELQAKGLIIRVSLKYIGTLITISDFAKLQIPSYEAGWDTSSLAETLGETDVTPGVLGHPDGTPPTQDNQEENPLARREGAESVKAANRQDISLGGGIDSSGITSVQVGDLAEAPGRDPLPDLHVLKERWSADQFEQFEERAAICHWDGRLPVDEAERLAALEVEAALTGHTVER